ncbi:MAG TPA: hypothetical protein VEV38_02860 [Candidatus Eremiobacteraceae bacterium]|nr:hypothetical protein [Candidatus Eremiobacteraceae bacterium]
MKQSRALATCATLERRAAAAVRASNAERRRVESMASDERDRGHSARVWIASQPLWTSDLCSILECRADRMRHTLADLTRRGARADASGAASDAERRRWARIMRGLERRLARAADLESPWPD